MKISRIYCPTATSLTSDFFSTKSVHGRVLALSILMEIDLLIIVCIWVKGKDFSTRCFFPRENWWKIKDFTLFFHIFFANFWKFIESQGFLIGKIGRICKEMMIFEFFGVFMQEKWNFFVQKPMERVAFRNLIIVSRIGFVTKMSFNQCIYVVVHLAPFLMS